MFSGKFEYSWNKLFQSLECDIFDIIEEKFDCGIFMADPFFCHLDMYINDEEFPEFYKIINAKYHTNFSLHEDLLLWDIESEIVKTDMLRFLSGKSLTSSIDSNLFKIFLDDPEKELNEHLLSVIKNGHFSYLKGGINNDEKNNRLGVLTVIQAAQNSDELTTTLIIRGFEISGEYEIVDAFPSMSILQSKTNPTNGMICYRSDHLGLLGTHNDDMAFWNFFEPLQFFEFSEGHTDDYIFWGLAYPFDSGLVYSDFNFEAAKIEPLKMTKINLSEYEETIYLGKKFLKVWINEGSIRIPVFVPENIIPKSHGVTVTEFETKVLFCGQIQPKEDLFR